MVLCTVFYFTTGEEETLSCPQAKEASSCALSRASCSRQREQVFSGVRTCMHPGKSIALHQTERHQGLIAKGFGCIPLEEREESGMMGPDFFFGGG